MATEVDLSIGINLTIGSIPVALVADIATSPGKTVYTFDGSVQDADIALGDFLGYVGEQFGVTVQLPPELNLTAAIDYIAGQIIQTKPTTGAATTELSIAGKFDLTFDSETFTVLFFADTHLASPAPASGNPYAIGAAIDTSLAFKNLPVVGSIPGFNDLTLTHIGFSYTNNGSGQTFSIPQVVSSPNPLYTGTDPSAREAMIYTVAPADASSSFSLAQQGFALTAGLTNASTGAVQQNFALPLTLPSTPPPTTPAQYLNAPTTPPATSVHWISINKQFGPINLQQIGLNYSQGEATFGFSAGFTLGPFTLELLGLTITFPLPLPGSPAGHTVSFDLQGLGFGFSNGSVTISGAFLKTVQGNVTSYFGEVAVQVATYGLSALGGYTPAYTDPKTGRSYPSSFFLYASLEVPIGGPPFLFVTGLAGGLGVNRSLILPTIDTLSGYILLPHNAPPQGSSPSNTIATVLPQLESVFLDEPGEYWAAAGLSFTSFEMIDAFALLTVSFGVDFEVAVLGSCSMTLPTGDPDPIAYIEIDLIASYTPASGLLAVAGKLSPQSYLYGGFCHLYGGFAFYTWFSGEHQGDFVVTAGGYSPYFNKPAHYPDVGRLGMNFSLGALQVTGQAYFALTPAMMMAGLTLTASWSSGPISASFGVGIDVLLAWAPFHYQADAYVSFACSANLGLFTIHVHVGADLTIWGPAFGGTAYVDLDVISFTITFGAAQAAPPPVGWATFTQNFLPQSSPSTQTLARSRSKGRRVRHGARRALATSVATGAADMVTNIIAASVTTGLQQSGVPGADWIIDSDLFAILTNSTIPANNGQWLVTGATFAIPNDVSQYNSSVVNVTDGPYLTLPPTPPPFSATQVWNPVLNIGPMKQMNVQSFHTVQLQKHEDDGTWTDITAVAVQPVWLSSNAALWAAPSSQPTANDPPLVPNALTGFQISPIPRHPDSVEAVPLVELLYESGFSTGFGFTAQAVDTRYNVSSTADGDTLTIDISGDHTAQLVDKGFVLSSLVDSWVTTQRDALLNEFINAGFSTLSPAAVALSVFATDTQLVDWPAVELLGEALAT